MARTKERYRPQQEIFSDISLNSGFRVGIYTRISQERKEHYRDKTQSLEHQIQLAQQYAKEHHLNVVKIYQDYEYTGTNFQRPGFQEMMEDIRNQFINCIIVKDLSRFGREYLEMGNYLTNVFPFLGVRFISINDKWDTGNQESKEGQKSFEIGLKNILNDLYAKDISKKVRSSKRELMKKGYHTGGKAPFGYLLQKEENGYRYIVDEPLREVIQWIFLLADEGKSSLEIAKALNDKKYNPPGEYLKTREVFRTKENANGWKNYTVIPILKNEAYIGHLVQHRATNRFEDGTRNLKRPEKEWIRVENCHEALVSKERFLRVQANLKERFGKTFFKGQEIKHPAKKDVFSSLMYCGVCGKPLLRSYSISCQRRYYRYHCKNREINKTQHVVISELKLRELILDTIHKILSRYQDQQYANSIMVRKSTEDYDEIKLSLQRIDSKIKRYESQIITVYENYCFEKLSLEDWEKEKNQINAEKMALEKERREIEEQWLQIKNEKKQKNEFIEDLKIYLETHQDEWIKRLIDRIDVYPNNVIKITFRIKLIEEVMEE